MVLSIEEISLSLYVKNEFFTARSIAITWRSERFVVVRTYVVFLRADVDDEKQRQQSG